MGRWTLDAVALQRVVPQLNKRDAERIADGLADAFRRFEITTPRRAAMAVSQWAHESAGFSAALERSSSDAHDGHLGDSQPGDGRRYKGRGRIMITGRASYVAVAEALGIDCVNRPELLERSPYCELASGWWWHAHGCNALCDRHDFDGLTRRISGGLNGIDDRRRYYARATAVARHLVPHDRWGFLTDAERALMETLATARRIAKNHGGWDRIDASHRARAEDSKRWMIAHRQDIWHRAEAEPSGWAKENRRERYALLLAATDVAESGTSPQHR